MSEAVDRPLAGVRVVDAVRGPLSAATRYLAELGARVDRIVRAPEDALTAQVAHAGKHDAADDADAAALLAAADIVVEDIGLDVAALRRAAPALVVVTVSAFGYGNALSGWQASDAVLHALSGELSRSGIRGRAPLLPPGRLAWQCAAVQAAFVTLQAYHRALRTGRGDHLDFAALDGAVQALDPGFGIGGSATLGRPAHLLSRDRPPAGFQYPILPCADGHVRLCLLAARQWRGMFRWMGEPAAFADPAFEKTVVRYQSPDLLPAIAALFAGRTRAELEEGAIEHGVPLSGLATLGETPALPHFGARQAFRHTAYGALPNGCIVVDGARMTPDPAPPAPRMPTGSEDLARAFDGLRVLDLGVIVVGAETARLLGDQGADVVKVESRAFPDGNRQSYLPYGLSASFAAGHRNKRALGLDLRRPEGKALFLRLVATADVVLSNFKPGTMESLGLGHDALAAANPRIVTVESSAFGDTGPWSRRMGYGPLVRAATGLTEAWRYPGDPEGFSDSITIYPDHVAGRIGAIAAVALLIRRARTGRGGRASVAQAEVMLAQFGREIALAQAGQGEAEQRDDAERSQVHRCAGDDDWCVVTERHDDDRRAIAALCGDDVAAWMARTSAEEAMRRLQAAGVPAGMMLRVADLPSFAYYRERAIFRPETHPFLPEPITAEARQAIGAGLAEPPQVRAPLMAEQTEEVLRDWLGLGADEIGALAAAQVVQRGDDAERAEIERYLRSSRA